MASLRGVLEPFMVPSLVGFISPHLESTAAMDWGVVALVILRLLLLPLLALHNHILLVLLLLLLHIIALVLHNQVHLVLLLLLPLLYSA